MTEGKLVTWHDAFATTVKDNSFEGFSMNYQPIYSFYDNQKIKMTALESLMRFRNQGESVSPEFFIPFAEKHGMITAVGDYALRAALKDFSPIDSINKSLSVNVNISYQQFFLTWFPESVVAYLETYNINPTQLMLEITESAYVTEFATVNDVVRVLRDLGIRFSIDDFGAGYANLALLSRIEYDCIKLDRSCIDGIETSVGTRIVLSNIKRMAQELGKSLVVEGVETKAQLNILQDMGFDTFQGWYFSKAMPIEKLARFA